jgi:hypothetical protein
MQLKFIATILNYPKISGPQNFAVKRRKQMALLLGVLGMTSRLFG